MKRYFVFYGYTNRRMRIERKRIFNDAIVSAVVCPDINPYTCHICTPQRHERCEREGGCQECRPTCEIEKRRILGLKGFGKISDKGEKRIKEIIQEAFGMCKKIRIKMEI